MSTEDVEKHLSDEATFAGAAKRRPPLRSLGDERTLGDRLGDQVTVIDDIEVVDLEARYKVEGTLGQDGMGAVLLATNTRLDRKVVVKRITGEVIVAAPPTSLQGEQPFASAGSRFPR